MWALKDGCTFQSLKVGEEESSPQIAELLCVLSQMISIRLEAPEDLQSIRKVNIEAFGTSSEADLVDRLRKEPIPFISLVATVDTDVVGHILFTEMRSEEDSHVRIVGLAPMAVLPSFQRRGIGCLLVEAGLEECKSRGYGAVFVLGHPEYYPRFGFISSSEFGITSEFDVPDEVFMAKEILQSHLSHVNGNVYYHPFFQDV